MKDIGRKSEFWSTWRIIGAVVLLFFGGKLLLCLHLSLIGRAVPGYTGTLKSEIVPDASEPVLYVYFVEGEDALHRRSDPWRGWRRGLQWGGQEVSIIYSPILPRVHVLSTTRGLSQPGALWREADYLLRLGLLSCGTLVGVALVLLAHRFPTSLPKGWHFLHGLHPKHPH